MKVAHIWYSQAEKELVRRLIEFEEPGWTLKSISEKDVSNTIAIVKLLKTGYDAILVHLSFAYGLAIKMAEICHRTNNTTKVILFSTTRADTKALTGFFDGIIRPGKDDVVLPRRITEIVSKARDIITDDELNQRIVAIFNTSTSLKSHYRNVLGSNQRGKEEFTLDDYHFVIDASMKKMVESDTGEEIDVFISYSTLDSAIATDLSDIFDKQGLSSFMARKSLSGGDEWQESIRQALIRSKVILILLTPHSITSQWVLIEVGASWVLGKPIFPCINEVDVNELPEPIRKHQCRYISTDSDKEKIGQELKARLTK
jgi:hypothetical protein